jgi:hypothetical protein
MPETPDARARPALFCGCERIVRAHVMRVVPDGEFLKLRNRHRPAKQVSLRFIASMLFEESRLRRSFHALGDHLQSQGSASSNASSPQMV